MPLAHTHNQFLFFTLDETLIVVTADHSHTFVMGGYPKRGNPILGLVDETGPSSKAKDKKRYTTLGYMNGPGAKINDTRDDPAKQPVISRAYKQQSLVPLSSETHGGEDVGKVLQLKLTFLWGVYLGEKQRGCAC